MGWRRDREDGDDGDAMETSRDGDDEDGMETRRDGDLAKTRWRRDETVTMETDTDTRRRSRVEMESRRCWRRRRRVEIESRCDRDGGKEGDGERRRSIYKGCQNNNKSITKREEVLYTMLEGSSENYFVSRLALLVMMSIAQSRHTWSRQRFDCIE